jgi:glycosyltransferase involved in cell wall biosynthesis
MKVAFFLLHYPVFSETFVSEEILSLQKLGTEGVIVCEKKNSTPPFHPHIKEIRFPVIEISQKIFSSDFFQTISAHFYWLAKNPLKYLKSIKLFFLFFNYHHFRVFIKSPLLAKNLSLLHLNIIYVHEVDSPCLYGLICSQLLNIPCGIVIHTQYLFAQNKYLATKIKNADFTIFQSKYSRQQAKKISKLGEKYFRHSHILSTPGIDTDFFKPSDYHQFSSQLKIISIGRLEEAKGFPILLQSIKKIKISFPDVLLTIVGDGSRRQILQTYINQNKLSTNVKLVGSLGHTPKLIKLMHSHDYFVLPSITDSQKVHDVHPNAIKEAMACGLIVITSNLGGISEIIQNRSNAFLVNKVTPNRLAKIIKTVHSLSNTEKLRTSAAARTTILKHHRQKNICQQLAKIFTGYINEK